MSKNDIDRRVTVLENRIDYLDQHGTRGVGVLQTQVGDIKQDLGKLEGTIEGLKQSVDRRNNNRWQTVVTYVVALIPLYVLLFMAVLHK